MLKYYSLNNQFLIRRPYFSLLKYYGLFKGDYQKNLLTLFSTEDIADKALLLASPDFYKILKDGGKENLTNKAILTLIKYASRFSSRGIPFGYFCGVSLSKFENDREDFSLLNTNPIKSKLLKLDNDVVFKIVELLILDDEVIKNIKFYSNPTLYKIGKSYKYIDYEYQGNQRKYVLNKLDNSSGIYQLIELCETGLNFTDIENFYLKLGADPREILGYVRTLVTNKILFTNLHPRITTPNTIHLLHSELSRKNINIAYINKIKEDLNHYNSATRDKREHLEALKEYVKGTLNSEFKNYFQLDYVSNNIGCLISTKAKNDIQEAINFLCLLPNKFLQKPMDDFIQVFKEKFGNNMISLNEVLDPHSGLGYPTDNLNKKLPFSMFREINFKRKNTPNTTIKWNWFDELVFQKYITFCKSGSKGHIDIAIEDIPKNLHKSNCQVMDLAVMAEVVNSTSNGIIVSLKGIGGKTPHQLIGRYSHLDKGINDCLIAISKQSEDSDRVQAEILNFPEDRLGNVVQHDPIFDYEIPIFSMTNAAPEKCIHLKDLQLFIEDNKLILFSKRLKKRIVPRLCNAHVYNNTNVPTYRFLCDYEHYTNSTTSHSFNWPEIFTSVNHLPRVMYKSITISPALWIIDEEELSSKKDKVKALEDLLVSRNIPQFVYFYEGDKKLLLNLHNKLNLSLLLTEVKKHKKLKVIESFIEDKMINLSEESYFQEVILTLTKNVF